MSNKLSCDQFLIIPLVPLARALVRRESDGVIHRSFFQDNLQKKEVFLFTAVLKKDLFFCKLS